MVKTVEDYMERYHMIKEGDVVVAGVSGGADSVCLFWILKEYCKKRNVGLVVVHINHGIRQDAVKDAEFVEKMCRESNVEIRIFDLDIPAYAKELGIGTEEAGRRARYEAFEEVRSSYGDNGKIAVAHNRNDLAETTLFHLLRGSGITGLSGILPVREHIIRPLLCVERKEIEQFLSENKKNWCIDSTNEENTYTRNKLRNVVFPYVEKEVCGQSIRHVANAAEEIAQVRSYLQEATIEAEKDIVEKMEKAISIRIEGFQKQHPVIQKQILLHALARLVPSRKDFGSVHIYDILSLFEKNSGRQIQLPYGLYAAREFDRIILAKQQKEMGEKVRSTVPVPGSIEFQAGKYIEFSLISAENHGEIPQKTYTNWFDYDKIICCLILRNREQGDYLTITSDGGRKSIKEYFIEQKVPRHERDTKLLLADGKHVLWVPGMRISEAYKITDQTKTILQVTISEETEYK